MVKAWLFDEMFGFERSVLRADSVQDEDEWGGGDSIAEAEELPPLREFKELGDAEQALLPMEAETGRLDSSILNRGSGSSHITLDMASPLLTEPVEQASHS